MNKVSLTVWQNLYSEKIEYINTVGAQCHKITDYIEELYTMKKRNLFMKYSVVQHSKTK